MDANGLIQTYVRLRDKKKEVQDRHKAELEPYDAGLMKIEARLHELMTETGVSKVGSDAGTAFLKINTSVSVADWDEVIQYVKINDAYDLLEKRVSKTAAQERGDVPGLAINQVQVIQVRRK